MKYVIVLGDGMADEPLELLGGKTPLEYAATPTLDRLAPDAEIGLARTVPVNMKPGSDTANLSVLGYNPVKYYTGRSPLEALGGGVHMEPSDVSFRCSLVTLSEQEERYEDKRMLDHSCGDIHTEDSVVLLNALREGLRREGCEFYAGVSYRHLLVCKNGKNVETTPPHDILTQRIGAYFPEDEELLRMMKKSYEILSSHPLNRMRREEGLPPANSAWFWGGGTVPSLDSFEEKTGKKGVMISAVDLLKGIAEGAGMRNLSVEGANGGLDTNYEGKADAAVDALLKDGYDFAYVHVEAPDEMGHHGDAMAKVQAIEYLDRRVIRRIADAFAEAGEDYRMLVMPDHPTPVARRTHTGDAVPYLLYDSRHKTGGCGIYNEKAAGENGKEPVAGYRMMEYLLCGQEE